MRGRQRMPDAVKRLKGNRRKEKLPAAADVLPPDVLPPDQAPPLAAIEPPEWLTHERERDIFRQVMGEFVPKNIARSTDYPAYARYAAYMHRWIAAKEMTDAHGGSGWYETDSSGGAGGVKMFRRFPGVTDMLEFGDKLDKLEAQLGLTPMSRQSIIARMRLIGAGGLGAGAPGGQSEMFEGERGEQAPALPDTPLGFLAQAAAASDAKN